MNHKTRALRSTAASIFARYFIVKPIGVSGAPTYVDPSYGTTYASEAPSGVYCDLTSPPTLVGQNTQPPSEKIFSAHFIVKPNVSGVPTYVDPSYGVTYNGSSDFENSAVFGYYDALHSTGSTSGGDPTYTVVPPNPAGPGITINP